MDIASLSIRSFGSLQLILPPSLVRLPVCCSLSRPATNNGNRRTSDVMGYGTTKPEHKSPDLSGSNARPLATFRTEDLECRQHDRPMRGSAGPYLRPDDRGIGPDRTDSFIGHCRPLSCGHQSIRARPPSSALVAGLRGDRGRPAHCSPVRRALRGSSSRLIGDLALAVTSKDCTAPMWSPREEPGDRDCSYQGSERLTT